MRWTEANCDVEVGKKARRRMRSGPARTHGEYQIGCLSWRFRSRRDSKGSAHSDIVQVEEERRVGAYDDRTPAAVR